VRVEHNDSIKPNAEREDRPVYFAPFPVGTPRVLEVKDEFTLFLAIYEYTKAEIPGLGVGGCCQEKGGVVGLVGGLDFCSNSGRWNR
jgi:hypothetical protein